MKRRTRNTLLIIVLAFAAAAVVSWPSVVRFIAQRGLEQARQNGANISWNGLTTGPSSVGLESLTIWIPGPKVKGTLAIPISLELQSLSVDLKLGSLLALSPAVTYGTGLYGGTISGDARREGSDPTHRERGACRHRQAPSTFEPRCQRRNHQRHLPGDTHHP